MQLFHITEVDNEEQWPWTSRKQKNASIGPLISVIIPLFNNKLYLEESIRSVVFQKYPNIELIIIDGGSTDGSLEIAQEYIKYITCLISEPDTGIYDAMNKGIDKANGEWIYFLGSDDFLEPNILFQLIPYLSSDKMLVYGDVCFDNGVRFSSFFNTRTIFQNTVHHQGAFYNYKLFRKFRYDINLRIISDYELNLYIYISRLLTQKVPFLIARCHTGGASSQILLSIQETNQIRRKYVKNKFTNWILSGLLHAYYGQKKFRSFLTICIRGNKNSNE